MMNFPWVRSLAIGLGATAAVGVVVGFDNQSELRRGEAPAAPTTYTHIDPALLPTPAVETVRPVRPRAPLKEGSTPNAAESTKAERARARIEVVGSRTAAGSDGISTITTTGVVAVPANCDGTSSRSSSSERRTASTARGPIQARDVWRYQSDFRKALRERFYEKPRFLRSLRQQRSQATLHERQRTR